MVQTFPLNNRGPGSGPGPVHPSRPPSPPPHPHTPQCNVAFFSPALEQQREREGGSKQVWKKNHQKNKSLMLWSNSKVFVNGAPCPNASRGKELMEMESRPLGRTAWAETEANELKLTKSQCGEMNPNWNWWRFEREVNTLRNTDLVCSGETWLPGTMSFPKSLHRWIPTPSAHGHCWVFTDC